MSISISKLLESLNTEWINCLKNLDDKTWSKPTLYKNQTIAENVLCLIEVYQEALINHFDADFEELRKQIIVIKTENTKNRFSLIVDLIVQYQKAINASSLNELAVTNLYRKSWLLQQYNRQALNNTILLKSEYYIPFLNSVLSDLPKTYKNVKAWLGATVKVEIVGMPTAIYTIEKGNEDWFLTKKDSSNPSALIYIDQNIAWLLFSNGIDLMDAKHYYQIHGDAELASHVFKLRI